MNPQKRHPFFQALFCKAVAAFGLAALFTPVYASTAQDPSTLFDSLGRVTKVQWLMIAIVLVFLLVLIYGIVGMVVREVEDRKAHRRKLERKHGSPELAFGRGARHEARNEPDFRNQPQHSEVFSELNPPTIVVRPAELAPETSAGAWKGSSSVYKSGNANFDSRSVTVTPPPPVEGMIDALTEAQLLSDLGLLDGAIDCVIKYLQGEGAVRPNGWLMLLDLYVRSRREADYAALAEIFRIQFNADVPSFETQTRTGIKRLEDYPGVMRRVQKMWGDSGCAEYLRSLIFDNRGGTRQGFMLEAYRDIVLLLDVIDALKDMEIEDAEGRSVVRKLS